MLVIKITVVVGGEKTNYYRLNNIDLLIMLIINPFRHVMAPNI